MTCVRPAAGGGRSSTGTPMLPPIATSRPASSSTWAISAVVVDLPLVPVMATNGASGALAPRSRAKSSMSPTIGTPASSARLTVQCGVGMGQRHAGREHEQPEAAPVGLSEIDQRNSRSRSAFASGGAVVPGGDFGAAGDQRPRGRQSRAAEAEQGDALVRAWSRPASSSPQLQRGEADHRQHEGDDPEPHDDLRLRPAELLEMMMDRRHAGTPACR